MIRIVRDDYLEEFHQLDVRTAISDLQSNGYSVTSVRRTERMKLFSWIGHNQTEIYYESRPQRNPVDK